MKSKEEIMIKHVVKDGLLPLGIGKDVLRAMDEYGRQCFKASRKIELPIESYYDALLKYNSYEDYLKELEINDLSK